MKLGRRTKPGLTTGRHHEIGRELAAIRNRLLAIATELRDAYPRTSRFRRRITRAIKEIDLARSEGDDRFSLEHASTFTPRAYYPGYHHRGAGSFYTDVDHGKAIFERACFSGQKSSHKIGE